MSPERENGRPHVVVVGGGFAGVGCVKRLAREKHVRVTLIDRHNYHQFQPLLYQVATSQLASSDIAFSLRKLFRDDAGVDVVLGDVASLDPEARTVTLDGGEEVAGDAIVLAAGSQPNFFRTPGAAEHAFPLYSLDDATRLRSRIIGVFEEAARDPGLIDRGALNFVVVGGGPTGVELAGALADLVHDTMSAEYHELAVSATQIHLVDLGATLLGPFSDRAHDYAAKVLGRKGVRLHLGTAVTEVGRRPRRARRRLDGSRRAASCGAAASWRRRSPRPPGCRAGAAAASRSRPTSPSRTCRASTRSATSRTSPARTATRIPSSAPSPSRAGPRPRPTCSPTPRAGRAPPFHYHDKGIMAMIGKGAAIAEVGPHRHELHGVIAFSAWLGVHASLMTGVRNRVDAFITWGWDSFSAGRGPQVLDQPEAARIDWGDDAAPEPAPAAVP